MLDVGVDEDGCAVSLSTTSRWGERPREPLLDERFKPGSRGRSPHLTNPRFRGCLHVCSVHEPLTSPPLARKGGEKALWFVLEPRVQASGYFFFFAAGALFAASAAWAAARRATGTRKGEQLT